MTMSRAKLLRVEMRKGYNNPLFILSLGISLGIASWSAISAIQSNLYYMGMDVISAEMSGHDVNPDFASYTVYSKWIGQDYAQLATSLFFMLLPIICSLPYAWSFFSERQSGYIKQVITRTSRSDYFASKYVATFLSGATVVIMPMLVNFLLVSSFLPSVAPDAYADIYYAISAEDWGIALFYGRPVLFVAARILLAGFFSGLIAGSVIGISFLVTHRYVAILSPFIILLIVNYLTAFIRNSTWEYSLVRFLHGGLTAARLEILAAYAVALGIIPIIIHVRGRTLNVF